MPTVLNIKPEELDSDEKRSKYTVSVIGCGHTGIFYANAFAEAGFKVVCTDADASVIKKVAKGKIPFPDPEAEVKLKRHVASGQLTAITELKKAVYQSDLSILTLVAKVNEQKKTDSSEIVNVCKQIGASLHQGGLVIYCGVADFGLVEGIMRETLENTSGLKEGLDFGLVYNPIEYEGTSIPMELEVAATQKTSLETAANFLKTIAKNVKQVSDIKTAEAAALFNVVKQDANRALANELAVFCENANIDYFEVLKLMGSDAQSFRPKSLENSVTKNGTYLLLDSAENFDTKLRLPALARQINEDIVKHAVGLTQNALRSCGKTLRRGRVAVLGVADPTTDIFVKLIEQKGAKVSLYDPASKKEPLTTRVVKTSLNEAVEGADCMVILTQTNRLNLKKLKPIMKSPSVIVDLTGALEPQEVKAEGFIYCGLGRGIV